MCPSTQSSSLSLFELIVHFNDYSEGIAAGYRPCGICMKEKYKIWKEQQNSTISWIALSCVHRNHPTEWMRGSLFCYKWQRPEATVQERGVALSCWILVILLRVQQNRNKSCWTKMKKSGYVHQDQRARFQNTGTLYTSVFLRLFRRTIHNIVCVFQYRWPLPENR